MAVPHSRRVGGALQSPSIGDLQRVLRGDRHLTGVAGWDENDDARLLYLASLADIHPLTVGQFSHLRGADPDGAVNRPAVGMTLSISSSD